MVISTHTPHARRDVLLLLLRLRSEISTHTPHARRDLKYHRSEDIHQLISTHTPHARRDGSIEKLQKTLGEFQLTRLMRGVTIGLLTFQN